MEKQSYLDRTRLEVDDFIARYKPLIEYRRDRRNRKVGVVVAYRHPETGDPVVGWSLCHTKLEPFNKAVGLKKAIDRAEPVDPALVAWRYSVPHSMRDAVASMKKRANKFFGIGLDDQDCSWVVPTRDEVEEAAGTAYYWREMEAVPQAPPPDPSSVVIFLLGLVFVVAYLAALGWAVSGFMSALGVFVRQP